MGVGGTGGNRLKDTSYQIQRVTKSTPGANIQHEVYIQEKSLVLGIFAKCIDDKLLLSHKM